MEPDRLARLGRNHCALGVLGRGVRVLSRGVPGTRTRDDENRDHAREGDQPSNSQHGTATHMGIAHRGTS